MTRAIKVVMLGCGTVGSEVARVLIANAAELTARAGCELELVGIAVKDLGRPRAPHIPPGLLTTRASELVTSDVDVVIELIGGVEPARRLVLSALGNDASVVTANKELLAADWSTLLRAARLAGRDLRFEAAVAGAIPIVGALQRSLAGDRVQRVFGIVNGTTNFVLDMMDSEGVDLPTALSCAQRLGLAEADPSHDIEGYDSAAKMVILANIAMHADLTLDDVLREGIASITPSDILRAQRLGKKLKLISSVERVPTDDGDAIRASVYPAMVPGSHALAAVPGSQNLVIVEAEAAGTLMFRGAGAGGKPTASAVLGDLVAVGRARLQGKRFDPIPASRNLTTIRPTEAERDFFVTIESSDSNRPLTAVLALFAAAGRPVDEVTFDTTASLAQIGLRLRQISSGELAPLLRSAGRIPGIRHVQEPISCL